MDLSHPSESTTSSAPDEGAVAPEPAGASPAALPDLNKEISQAGLAHLRRHGLLRTLIQRRVVAAAVAEEPVGNEDREAAVKTFRQRNGIRSREDLERFLLDHGLTPTDLEWQVLLPVRIRSHCARRFLQKAEARFLSRKNHLDQVVYSLLRVRDVFLARELYLRISDREADFADLAARFAEGPERTTKGIVGPAPLTKAHPILAEKLRTATPGVLMEPFRIEDWWLVARLEKFTPATFDEAMALQMASELFEEWVKEETTRKLRQLLQDEQGVPSMPA